MPDVGGMKMQRNSTPCIVHSHDTTWHDAGVAMLLSSGEIVALASERVGDRIKHSHDASLAYRYLFSHIPPQQGAVDDQFRQFNGAVRESDRHHLNHAASSFYGSGYKRAAILVADGQGTESGTLHTTTIWHGVENSLSMTESIDPDSGSFAGKSIGHFYTAIGSAAGILELNAEGKTMGLAPYGSASRFIPFFERFVQVSDEGLPKIDERITYAILANTLGPKHYGWPPPSPEQSTLWAELQSLRRSKVDGARPTQDDADIAFAGQMLLERIMIGLAKRARALTGERNLCLAGGVSLNCVANDVVRKSKIFDEVFVFPAAGDDGQALGKLYLDIKAKNIDVSTTLVNAYLGPCYGPEDLKCINPPAGVRQVSVEPETIEAHIAARLAAGAIIGCCRGRSEIGPRALGHRSIFADPRLIGSRDRINHLVKRREWYRPVAPIVLEDRCTEFFDLVGPSKFMTFAVDTHASKRHLIPAVVHVDGTARVQTLNENDDPFLHRLLREFSELTDIPMLVNTSFNKVGEPIVETYHDAMRAFASMDLDGLLLESSYFEKIK